MNYCVGISVVGLQYLTELQNLQILHIDGIPHITELCVISLLKSCKEIKAFHLCSNPNLTSDFFQCLLDYAHHLKKIFLFNSCSGIDKSVIDNVLLNSNIQIKF